ncbi:Hpt domain-containing protein [Hyphococcus luteus]|uniref:HPt domain-containing protein n=1 Tax=Hyphococcus luteus TaxID=2058213 RepID=A0A2S7K4B5_9PROT|nr:Hpt domain-containing protein [Marinicaulis flavus]PQA87343.1 hypothetical protein CW354_13005 [Marinicaulis flavus]
MTEPQTVESGHLQVDQVNSLVSAAGVDGARAILDAFQRSTNDLLASLTEGVRGGALDDASRDAHAVKGSAANVGAQTLSETAALIEKACKAGDAAAAAGMLAEAQSMFDLFCVHFEAHLEQF